MAPIQLYDYTTMIQYNNNELENEIIIAPLSPKEREVLDYIKNVPGQSKEAIIRYFKDKDETNGYSRNPMYKTFDVLKKYGMIKIIKDENNKQTNNLHINNDSLFVNLIYDTKIVNTIYLELLNKSETIFKKSKDDDAGLITDLLVIIRTLLSFYKWFIDIYLVKLFLEFPNQAQNNYLINKSYLSFFSETSQILTKLSSLYSKCHLKICSIYKVEDKSILNSQNRLINVIINNDIFAFFWRDSYELIRVLRDSKRFGFGDKVEKLLDLLVELFSSISKIEEGDLDILNWRKLLLKTDRIDKESKKFLEELNKNYDNSHIETKKVRF